MSRNIGEIDELKAALSLIYWRDNDLYNTKTVGYYIAPEYNEYYEYPSHNLTLDQINKLTKEETKAKCKEYNIIKASSILKADICLNGKNISLKSKRGALPALINHTHRAGIEKVCKRISFDIKILDKAITEYWKKRLAGEIKEDIKMNDLGSPFEPIKSDLAILLAYFLFEGSARGDSPVKAEALIEIDNVLDFSTWREYSKINAINHYIDKVTISIRSKAMPITYKHEAITERDKSIFKWTEFSSDAYRGSLHVRG